MPASANVSIVFLESTSSKELCLVRQKRLRLYLRSLLRSFLQRLNDYKLREIVIAETKDIRTILYAKAFADCEDFSLEEK